MLKFHSLLWGGDFLSTILPGGWGGGVKKRTLLRYEAALHMEKLAEFQMPALVECLAFLTYLL